MVDDVIYKDLSDASYDIETNKVNPKYNLKSTSIEVNQRYYKLLKKLDSGSGMQMMATIETDINHNIISDDIIFSYAGTDIKHNFLEDISADISQVVLGVNNIQAHEAYITTNKWIDEFKVDYPNARFSVTGHSLGGYNALYVASKIGLDGVVFNAPNPNNNISDEDAKRLRTLNIINYKDKHDFVGYGGGVLHAQYYPGLDEPYNVYVDRALQGMQAHELILWQTDKYGNIIDNSGQIIKYHTTLYRTRSDLEKLGIFSAVSYGLTNVLQSMSSNKDTFIKSERIRDFSDEVKQQLLMLVTTVEQESIFDVAHWDIFYKIEKIFSKGKLITNNAQEINDYYRKSIDIDNITREQIIKIFDEVYAIDQKYATIHRKISEKLHYINREMKKIF